MSRPLIAPMQKTAAKSCGADCTCADCKKKMAAKTPKAPKSGEVPGDLKPALTPANTPAATPAADISLNSAESKSQKEPSKSPMAKKAYLERQGDYKPVLRNGMPEDSARKVASVQRQGEYKPERHGPFDPQLR